MSSPGPQAEMLANRIRKNRKRLEEWAARDRVTCYRLYDRDIPEVPVSVDRYGDRLHLSRYLPTRSGDPRRSAEWIEAMAAAAAEAAGVEAARVYVKERRPAAGGAAYRKLAEQGERLVVEEAGLKFRVNLSDYLDTGLFLDHRVTRGWVRDGARGKRVLNLFAYTGSFTVYAAAGGASATTSVDLSNTYLDWARENLRLNGLDGPQHRRVRADAGRFLEEAGERWDVIVCDPPSFSKSKGMHGDFDVQRDHPGLVSACLAVLAPGGTLWFSTNRRGFRLDLAAVAAARGLEVTDLTRESLPPDFHDPETHRLWRLRR